MKKIAHHIEMLLRRHDYVILPGFGGFIVQRQSAKINEDFVLPPFASVGFNPLMNISDGLLAIEISRVEHKSFRESVLLIEEELLLLKQSLKKEKTVQLGNLGELRLNPDDKIEFIPSGDNTIFPSNYGMATLYYSKLAQVNNSKKTVTISMPSQRKVTRYAAVGVLVFGLMFVAPTLNDMRNNTASLNPMAYFNSNKQVEQEQISQKDCTTQPVEATSKSEAAVPSVVIDKHFHVIVGCLASQKKAEELCDELRSKKYTQAHILPPIKTFRVAVQSFDNEKDAVDFMQNVRRAHAEYSEAWVLNF